MSSDGVLFGEEMPEPSPSEPAAAYPITDEQVAQLRAKLDLAGLRSMEDRQQLIEQLAGRTVASLRDLTSAEARVLLLRVHTADGAADQPKDGTTWDTRDEDTWIDRL